MREKKKGAPALVGSLFCLLALSACRPSGVDPGDVGGGSTDPGPAPTSTPRPTPTATPTSTPIPTPTPTSTPPVDARSCISSDPDHQCLGLKLVSYQDQFGTPTLSRGDTDIMVGQMNTIWSTCNIGFQLEEYESVDPTVVGLSYGAASENELTSIRKEFSDRSTFLVAVTGPWTGRTIAWTVMPGSGPFGTVVEKDYGRNAMTVGHELGHYMGLYHLSSSSNLMNAYIGSNTSGLTDSQCEIARQTNFSNWRSMLRQ